MASFEVTLQLSEWIRKLKINEMLSTELLSLKFYLFLERGEGREKERERNINVSFLLTHPLPGTWPTTQHVP